MTTSTRIDSIAALRRALEPARRAGQTIALVPTMGALHAGHGSLIERARRESDVVVVSVFVNPIQFDNATDFAAYQINLDADTAFCGERGADLVFAPPAGEMYPPDRATHVEVERLGEHLCGRFRPGHFRGVTTVVAKLFNIVQPHRAYFGEKDAQQLAIIERMVRDLDFPIEIVPVETVREPDGVAMSSRNRRLSPGERGLAPLLYAALSKGRTAILEGCTSGREARQLILDCLAAEPQLRPEYVEVVDAASMEPVEDLRGRRLRLAAAVWLGSTRLIDNVAAVCLQQPD